MRYFEVSRYGSFLQADLEIIPKETQCTDVTFDFANDSAKVFKRINLRAMMAQVLKEFAMNVFGVFSFICYILNHTHGAL